MLKKVRFLAEQLSMEYHFPEEIIIKILISKISPDFSLEAAEEAMRASIQKVQSGKNYFTFEDIMKMTGLNQKTAIDIIHKVRQDAIREGKNPDDIAIEFPDVQKGAKYNDQDQ